MPRLTAPAHTAAKSDVRWPPGMHPVRHTDSFATEAAPLACVECSCRPVSPRTHFGKLLKPEAPTMINA